MLLGVGRVVRLVGEVDQQDHGGDHPGELLGRVADQLGVGAGAGPDGAVVEADDVLAAPPGAPDQVVLGEGDGLRQPSGGDQLPVLLAEHVQRVR